MKRRTKRQQQRAARQLAREQGMRRPGGSSAYAKKRDWLRRHGGWGFEYAVKPWRSA